MKCSQRKPGQAYENPRIACVPFGTVTAYIQNFFATTQKPPAGPSGTVNDSAAERPAPGVRDGAADRAARVQPERNHRRVAPGGDAARPGDRVLMRRPLPRTLPRSPHAARSGAAWGERLNVCGGPAPDAGARAAVTPGDVGPAAADGRGRRTRPRRVGRAGGTSTPRRRAKSLRPPPWPAPVCRCAAGHFAG